MEQQDIKNHISISSRLNYITINLELINNMAQKTDLKKLEEKFEALFKEETEESFNKWLADKQQDLKTNNMAQQIAVEMEQYMQKLIEKFKQDPKWELQQEFGRMLMRNIDSFTNEERFRYEQLKELLKD